MSVSPVTNSVRDALDLETIAEIASSVDMLYRKKDSVYKTVIVILVRNTLISFPWLVHRSQDYYEMLHSPQICIECEGNVCNDCSTYINNPASCSLLFNECELDVCSENASCNNLPGSFNCVCYDGFRGDGIICEGIAAVQNS